MAYSSLQVIIMAAGLGKRMKSHLPKVLHPLAGRPLLTHILTTVRSLLPKRIVAVIGNDAKAVRETFSDQPDLIFVEQDPPRGTGDAARLALSATSGADVTLVINGDCPLIPPQTMVELVEHARQDRLAWLTARVSNPSGLGRVIRDQTGKVTAIVEEYDADDAQKKIDEINVGVLAAPTDKLARWVGQLGCDNAQREYYLTDVLAMAVRDGVAVEAVVAQHEDDTRGINDRAQLAEAERIVQRRRAQALMREGVTLADPARIDIRGKLTCGADVFIDVGCIFEGDVSLGNYVSVGAYCIVRDTTIGEHAEIKPFSYLDGAIVARAALIGPYARLRPGTNVDQEAHVGNFVELKATRLGARSKANHLAYLGDAVIGEDVNVGAGTITCNYDGENKYKTIIEDRAFIGSNSALIAPLTIGQDAVVGAGSTLSDDVEEKSLTFTRTRPIVKSGWQRLAKKKE
ncbi:MAG: bifunctional UDP-N-acetylglucosamine diphosphorylase/glucosamine-1-phosphate N-acetyltransferase GlmU [Burkholderiales bacterium]|jgi:bifunctional UDP-N-acetylglucosamine pyrophosphorylase/glucosamine-1-phosphate N-acetyltransferase|nr:bifunctional UDP-N-acetylglucosamine diphosphorylase/glucosamine-1-phosphate N-acetyltransferase GlmU [Burkholderiales bacterium]